MPHRIPCLQRNRIKSLLLVYGLLEGAVVVDLLELYLLNLAVTVGMFVVLIFRAWIEHKHFKLMWKELEWRKTYNTASRILRAEKELFTKVEGGEELYNLLLEMFKAKEE